MIDDRSLQDLLTAHKRSRGHLPACSVVGDVAYVHSRIMMLELPAAEVQLKKKAWPGTSCLPDVTTWRDRLPKTTYLRTNAIHGTDQEGHPCVQLLSPTGDAAVRIQTLLYDFFREHLDNPAFRITAGGSGGAMVFVSDRLVGAIAPLLYPTDS
jgi:hypothetical protein